MNNNNRVMRKLRLQVQMSIDGCIAGPNNEMDWLVWDDNDIKYLNEITESVDTIIMGRRGMGKLRQLVLGSTSTKVLSHSDCTVVIVK